MSATITVSVEHEAVAGTELDETAQALLRIEGLLSMLKAHMLDCLPGEVDEPAVAAIGSMGNELELAAKWLGPAKGGAQS